MDKVIVTSDAREVASAVSQTNLISVDIETTGLNPHDSRILLVQIGSKNHGTYILVIDRNDLDPLRPLFESEKVLKIFQNGSFDQSFLMHNYHWDIKRVYDTFLAEKLINYRGPRGSHGLETLALKYAGVKLDKTIRSTFSSMRGTDFTQEQLDYAAKDVQVLFPIFDAQAKLLKESGQDKIAKVEFDLSTVVAAMEIAGMPVNIPKWKTLIEETSLEHAASKQRLFSLIYDDNDIDEQMGMFEREPMNIDSNKQLLAVLNRLGINAESTSEQVISLIDHPVAQELLHYRGLQKIMSSYGESFLEKIHPFTGRIHADFQQIGTETGRFSCRTPNLQQMPEKFRECISLEPDYKIVVADYSQIELRILAEYSQDKSFLHAFNNDIDLHSATAALMFNLPLEKVGKNSPERFAAKTINFGIAYGMGAGKLMNMLNKGKAKKDRIPLYKARNMLNKYKEGYVDVIRWLERAGNEAYARGYSETILGRRRTFTDVYGEDRDSQIAAIKRQGANTPIQGTNADITKIAMFRLYRELKDNEFKAEIIGQVHDEIVVLAHKSQAGAVKEIVVNSMVNSAQEILTVPVKVDAYVSDIWKKG